MFIFIIAATLQEVAGDADYNLYFAKLLQAWVQYSSDTAIGLVKRKKWNGAIDGIPIIDTICVPLVVLP